MSATKQDADRFGQPIAGSRWFNGEPNVTRDAMIPVRLRWLCPIESCGGEMIFNGMTWPTGDPGYHHTCNKCEFTAAVHGRRYPSIAYEPAPPTDQRKE
jgi:hypothetical protein